MKQFDFQLGTEQYYQCPALEQQGLPSEIFIRCCSNNKKKIKWQQLKSLLSSMKWHNEYNCLRQSFLKRIVKSPSPIIMEDSSISDNDRLINQAEKYKAEDTNQIKNLSQREYRINMKNKINDEQFKDKFTSEENRLLIDFLTKPKNG